MTDTSHIKIEGYFKIFVKKQRLLLSAVNDLIIK